MASRLFLSCLAAALMACPAHGAGFKPHRGLSLDIWQTWPNEDRWDESGVMLPWPEWRKTIGAAELEALRQVGLDFIRVPIDPAPLLSDKTQAFREVMLDGVAEAARAVNAAGLKALIDLHAIPAGGRTHGTAEYLADADLFDRYAGLVGDIAKRLADADPAKVAFELMNEPVADCEGDEAALWSAQLKRLHETARAAAPKLTLVLSGACWGSADGLAALDPKPFGDANILWSFHSYDPFLLTHQGAGWAGDFIVHVTGLPYPLHASPRAGLEEAVEKIRAKIRADAPFHRRAGLLAYLDEQIAALDSEKEMAAAVAAPFVRIEAWAKANGVDPADILLGEFGMIRQAWGAATVVPAGERTAFYRDVITEAEQRGFAWSMWSYGSDFGIVDEFGGRKAETDIMEMVRELPAR